MASHYDAMCIMTHDAECLFIMYFHICIFLGDMSIEIHPLPVFELGRCADLPLRPCIWVLSVL